MRARPHGQRHYRTEHFTRVFRAATAAVLVGVLSVSGISPASAATPSPTPSPTVANAAFTSAPTPTFTGSMGTGSKLTASTGTWTPTPDAFTYQWRRNGIAIAGATAKSFTLTPDEFGKAITVTVTATKSGYVKTTKTSARKTAVAGAFTSAPSPTIGGNLAIGSTLTARVSTWSPTPGALTYQWKRDGFAIPGATASTYRLAVGDGGAAIAVTVTAATRGYVSTTRTSAPASIPASSFTTAPTPTFSGSLSVGSTLTASAGTWAPVPGALTFAWSRNGKAISGATGKTYVLVPDDNGAKISVSVTATKAGHTTTTKTSAARTATPGPFITAPVPTIVGTGAIGATVTAAPGAWAPVPALLEYQWNRSGTAIAGATASTYRVGTADAGTLLTVTVTASAPGYVTTTRVSAGKSVPTRPFATTPMPTFSGTARVGSTLTASPGAWSPVPDSLTYQWNRGGAAISGATGSTYTVAAADVGRAITVSVTAVKAGYTRTSTTSTATTATAATFSTAPTPTVTGLARVGGTLFGVAGAWDPQPSALTYQWTRNGTAIAGATSATYLVTTADRGAQLRFTVTAARAGYTGLTRVSAAQAVPGVFSSSPTPRISGALEPGSTVSAVVGSWTPKPDSFRFQWRRNGNPIAGATSKSYTLTQADAGAKLSVTVTAVKANYSSTSKTSAPAQVASTAIVRVTSDIAADTTWAPSTPTVYVLERDIQVASGVTLTIGAGTVVKFGQQASLNVEGSLIAKGTTTAPVTFTSLFDDTAGGDTLADGDDTTPTPGSWTGITVSGRKASLTLDRVRIGFAQYGVGSGETLSTSVTSSTIDGGISAYQIGGAVTVTGNTVKDGSITIDRPDGSAFAFGVTVTGNTIQRGNLTVRSENYSAAAPPIKVTGNTITGFAPGYHTGNEFPLQVRDVKLRPSNLTGNTVTGNTANVFKVSGILIENWTLPTTGPRILIDDDTSGYDDLTITTGATLTAPAGTVVKFGQQASLNVEGSLIAKGTTTAPVTFTSLFDDTAGGDTLADGDDTTPTPGSWTGITVSGRKASLTLDRVRIGFAQYGVGSGETLSTSVTSSTIDGGISAYQIGGAVTVTGNTVKDGSITIDRPDGSAFAFGVTVTGNTIQRGNLTVRSENYSAAAPPIKVTGNTITGFAPGYHTGNEFPLQVRDVKLRPSNLTGNTVTGNTANVFKVSGILIENWTLPTTGPRILIDDDTSGYDDLTITTGATLTAPAGTVVKFGQQASLNVEGSLIAKGTTTAPVTFTSLFDDTAGGDTLADGDDTTPTPGSWTGITVSGRKASLTLDRVRIGFAQYGVGSGETLSTSVTSSTIDGGISAYQIGGAVTVTGNTVKDGSITIDRPDGSAFAFGVTVTGNTIQRGNLTVRSENYSAAAPPIKVTGNTITGFAPGYHTGNEFPLQVRDVKLRPSNLTGNTVTGNTANVFKVSGILIENWTLPTTGPRILIDDDTSGYDDLTITTGATLTAPAGTVVKFGQQASLNVEGSLIAKGTTTAPVTFTSLFDDTAGGDTLADGDDTTPTPGSWTGISLARGSFGGTNVAIRFAASGVVAVDISSLALSDSTIQKTSDICINVVGADATSYFHGVLRDCPVGVSGGLTPFDATNVDWGSNRSPGNGFDGRPRAQGPGVQVLPWVGWVEPPAATRPASPAPNTTSCADFLFVGVRGSGEPESSTTGGMGAMVWSVYQQLKRNMRAEDPNVSFRTIGLDYPAYAVPMSASNAPDLFTYNQGAWQGALELMSVLKDETDRCAGSGEKIVLGGYSQGSWVIHATLSYASRSQKLDLSTIASVGLVADPQRQAYAPELNVGTASESSWGIANAQVVGRPAAQFSGWLAGSIYPEVKKFAADNPTSDDMLRVEDIPAAMLAKTVTICDSHDPVCALGADNDIDVHSGYANHLDTFTSELTWTTRAFGG